MQEICQSQAKKASALPLYQEDSLKIKVNLHHMTKKISTLQHMIKILFSSNLTKKKVENLLNLKMIFDLFLELNFTPIR